MVERTTIIVPNPSLVESKAVDDSGRVYLGKEYAGETVRLIIERNDEPDETPETPETPAADESAFARELSRQSIASQYGDDYFSTHPGWDEDLPDLGENA